MSADESLITSSTNPLVTKIRKLATRKGRKEFGQSFVEGIAVVHQAVASGVELDTIVVAPKLLESDDARATIDTAREHGVSIRNLDASLFRRLSDRDNPSGIGAVVAPRAAALEEISLEGKPVVVLVDGVSSPGNLGTIARTADAVGARGLIVTGTSTDPWDPASIKASMGTLFELPVSVLASATQAIDWARAGDVPVIATSARAESSIHDADIHPPAMLMFGSERHGLDRSVLERSDMQLRIPLRGHASSLNLAVAAGIFLYELTRPA
ncbi:MAG: TrmH family RNA methyltransferase [Actinomycetota bacterium]